MEKFKHTKKIEEMNLPPSLELDPRHFGFECVTDTKVGERGKKKKLTS